MTVSSRLPEQSKDDTVISVKPFEMECDGFIYEAAINETLEKFDEHLYSYVASSIESKIISNIKKSHKKKCLHCIEVFYENELVEDDFISKKNSSNELKIPCLSTLHIIKASNKIFNILEQLDNDGCTEIVHDRTLITIMNLLPTEKLFTRSDFKSHEKNHTQWTHKEKFIYEIVLEYMKQKSRKIGSRITEEEKGKYIRHNNKKLVHFSGQ